MYEAPVPYTKFTMKAQLSTAFNAARKGFNGRLISPYQNKGVMWMLAQELKGKGGMLCDEMGLGKTAQTVATMIGNPKPKTLVVAPKSVIHQWVEEIKRFAPQFSSQVMLYDGPGRNGLDLNKPECIVVAPYSLMTNRKEPKKNTLLHTVQWDRIVLDEGHEIRNRASKTHKSAMDLKGVSKWIVTGTPVFNSIRDFVALCEFLGIPKNRVQAYPEQIRAEYILRRTKEDVAHHNERLRLPPCEIETVELDMSPEEHEVYKGVFEESSEIVRDIFRNSTNIAAGMMNILECLLRIRQCMVHPQLYYDGIATKDEDELRVYDGPSVKLDKLCEFIQEHPKEKSLVFCQFISEMDMIQERIHELGINTYRIDGSVISEERQKKIQAFKSDGTGAVFIIQIKAGGVGLNLQEATRVYITGPAWNPATELQAIARAHRTGQTKKVYVKKLIYTGNEEVSSVEQSILKLQESKSEVTANVLCDDRLKTAIPFANRKGIDIKSLKYIFSKDK